MYVNAYTKDTVRWLISKGCWGEKHTPEDRVLKRLKQRTPDREQKSALKEYEKLVKQNVIMRQKKTNADHVSLNPEKAEEITAYIK